MFIEANPQFKTINIYSPANRHNKKSFLKQDHASAKVQGERSEPRSGGKSQQDLKEGEKAEPGGIKEEELELSENKQTSRRKAHK
jgi:hypothetical protein